jgi:hypothetical protein
VPSSCLMLGLPFGPNPTTEGENRMAGFLFRLELEGGTPADPPTFESWKRWATATRALSVASFIGRAGNAACDFLVERRFDC